jgi:hypothetical protein
MSNWGPKKPNLPHWLQASAAQVPGDTRAEQVEAQQDQTPVSFPRHLYPPQGVYTIDMRINRLMDPGEVFDLIDFTPLKLGITSAVYITQYGIFNNGLLESQFSFLPTLNNRRIYPYHGNPLNTLVPGNFLISLGLAPDLSDESLINGYLVMNPPDRLRWTASNMSAVPTAMGVRVVGYVDSNTIRTTQQFGG